MVSHDDVHCVIGAPLVAWADRAVARFTHAQIAISQGLARYLAVTEGFAANAFTVVHYGIEPGPEPPPPPDAPRLAAVGRLIPIKGHQVLLEAFAAAREEVPELTLDLAGTGPLEQELRELKSQADAMRAQWESERQALRKVQALREELEQLRQEAEQAERAYDLTKAAELRLGRLPELERRLHAEEEQLASKQGTARLLREVVTEEEIAQIVARWTGIPVSRLQEAERDKLLRLDEILHERIVGQDEAVQAVADAIIRARSGIKDPRQPIGSFLFLGPTGVGKTELAKTLAAALFDTEDNMVRLDMSEYQERHTVSRLVGAPPGYVGYEEGGQLTEAVRRKPYSVVLFDEIEKAHPDIFNTLLQVLDDGRLTDGQGRIVDFKNTVLILTTNLGTRDASKAIAKLGFAAANDTAGDYERMKQKVTDELKQHFRPEFLNRIDDTIVFHPLSQEEIVQIVDLMTGRLDVQLRSKDMGLELTPAAKSLLAEKGYDKALGARPLRRTIQREIEDALSEKILFGELVAGQIVVVDVAPGEDGKPTFTFRGESKSAPVPDLAPVGEGGATE
jgi:ATP-dependent Clp protease ATP-binding subunit ClpB